MRYWKKNNVGLKLSKPSVVVLAGLVKVTIVVVVTSLEMIGVMVVEILIVAAMSTMDYWPTLRSELCW